MDKKMEKHNLVIIGAGPAGLSAAIYARRAGIETLILEQGRPGGQILTTNRIENYPGVPETTGASLAESLRAHAISFSPQFKTGTVQSMSCCGDDKLIVLKDGSQIIARTVIVATGAGVRRQGCPGEGKYTGLGVSYCAVCDAPFFEDLDVAVIGGGNTAVEEAIYLTNYASKVYIIHRRDEFRADKIAVERALSNPKIVPVLDSVLESIDGSEVVEKIRINNVKTNIKSYIDVCGVFIFIGTIPNTKFVNELVNLDNNGYIITDENMSTSVPGIFAAGDVRNTQLRQVITAAAVCARATISAYKYLNK